MKRHNVCKRHIAIDTGFKQTEGTIFPLCYFNGIKNFNCFQMYIWRTVPKLSVNFGNHNRKTLTRIDLQARPGILVLQNHNTVTNVDQICRRSAISFPFIMHTEYTVLSARSSDSCSSGFVWNQSPSIGIDNIIKWHHHWTSVLSTKGEYFWYTCDRIKGN